MKRLLAVALLLASALPAAAEKLPSSDPLAQLLIRADRDRDFVVTLAEADAEVAESYAANVRDATASWLRTLKFIGLPPETRSFLPSQHVAAVVAILRAADAGGNGDGTVDRDEINAAALKVEDAEIRQDMLDVFEVADADHDDHVTPSEMEGMVAAAKEKDDKPLVLDEVLEGIKADGANDARLVAELFSKNAADGNLKLSDVVE